MYIWPLTTCSRDNLAFPGGASWAGWLDPRRQLAFNSHSTISTLCTKYNCTSITQSKYSTLLCKDMNYRIVPFNEYIHIKYKL